jgi:putative redox protein
MGVEMSLVYQGGLRCELMHGPSKTRITTDAPTDNQGKGEAFSPTDLVAAALASCAVTTMAIMAKKEGLPFTTASAKVEKNMLSDPRRIGLLSVRIELPASLTDTQRARLEQIGRSCPVVRSLGGDVSVEMDFHYT